MPIPKRLKRFQVELAGITTDTPDGPKHGPPRRLPAYQEEKHQVVAVQGGQEAVSTVQVWLDPVAINLGDKVTVTTKTTGERKTLRVLALDRYEGDKRAAHVALKLG